MNNKTTIPPEWQPTTDWSSHRPLLYAVLCLLPGTSVVELGCGDGSTNLICGFCEQEGMARAFTSLDTNVEWARKYRDTFLIADYLVHIRNAARVFEDEMMDIDLYENAIVFVDCAPGEIRKDIIELLKERAAVIVVHDSEPGAEYVYGLSPVLKQFRHRVDLVIPGMPSTTAVSNKVELDGLLDSLKGYRIIKYAGAHHP